MKHLGLEQGQFRPQRFLKTVRNETVPSQGTGAATKLVDDTFYSSNTTTTFPLASYSDYSMIAIILNRYDHDISLTLNNCDADVQTSYVWNMGNHSTLITAFVKNINANSSYSVYCYGTDAVKRVIVGIK